MAAASVMEAPSMVTELIVKGQPRVQWTVHTSNLIPKVKSLLTLANFTNGAREAVQSLMTPVFTSRLAKVKIALECLAPLRRPTSYSTRPPLARLSSRLNGAMQVVWYCRAAAEFERSAALC
jgi:hypothetical protein